MSAIDQSPSQLSVDHDQPQNDQPATNPTIGAPLDFMALGVAALEGTDLYRFYHAGDEETLALRGVSIRLDRGEIVAVTGPSGSGKSTLLACLAGLDEPDGGMVRCDGVPLSRQTELVRARLRGDRIGMLFQSNNLIEHLSVVDNVMAAQRLSGRADRDSAVSLLNWLQLSKRTTARPATLSGGEAARAGLAVALANRPAVLLCDEPTGELDYGTAVHVLGLLRTYADYGNAVMIVTHDPKIAQFADREVCLRDGRVQP
jgi:putative ABC transport system ATP-binding protein